MRDARIIAVTAEVRSFGRRTWPLRGLCVILVCGCGEPSVGDYTSIEVGLADTPLRNVYVRLKHEDPCAELPPDVVATLDGKTADSFDRGGEVGGEYGCEPPTFSWELGVDASGGNGELVIDDGEDRLTATVTDLHHQRGWVRTPPEYDDSGAYMAVARGAVVDFAWSGPEHEFDADFERMPVGINSMKPLSYDFYPVEPIGGSQEPVDAVIDGQTLKISLPEAPRRSEYIIVIEAKFQLAFARCTGGPQCSGSVQVNRSFDIVFSAL